MSEINTDESATLTLTEDEMNDEAKKPVEKQSEQFQWVWKHVFLIMFNFI